MRKALLVLLAVAAVVIGATRVAAQSTPQFKLQWDQPEAIGTVNGFAFTLKIDLAAPQKVVATCSPATPPSTGSVCQTILPTLVAGSHTLIINSCNGFGCAPGPPLSGQPPSAPSGMKVILEWVAP